MNLKERRLLPLDSLENNIQYVGGMANEKSCDRLQSFPFSSEIIYIGELFILSYLEYEVPVSDVFFGIDIIIAPGLLFVNTFLNFIFSILFIFQRKYCFPNIQTSFHVKKYNSIEL